jgi:hypothetical protein
MKFSSSRLMRIIAGRLIFWDILTGIAMLGTLLARAFCPKPPPVASLIKTKSSTGTPQICAIPGAIADMLWDEPCR